MLRVVAHEDGYEESQDEDRTKQIEDDEEKSISLRRKRPRLGEYPRDTFRTPHDIDPALLRHDLEEDEERSTESVKIIVRIRYLARGKDFPLVGRATILVDTVVEVEDVGGVVIADLHLAVE